MNNVRIQPGSKLAYVGGGALWEQVDRAAIEHGMHKSLACVNH